MEGSGMRALVSCMVLATAALPQYAKSQTTSVGRLQGSFAVSSTGAATYTIPLWIPPGARGMQPQLSLNYNSRGPNDLLGPGWSLGGLSFITRCNQTFAQDTTPSAVTLTASDKFCIDGRRLRLTSGTYGADASVYQTEIADFSQVTFHAASGIASSYFEVQRRDGTTWEYGNTTDSRAVMASGGIPITWGVNKVSDRYLNNWIVQYNNVFNGTMVPKTIQYTQTTTNSAYDYDVSFVYLTLSAAKRIGYIAGAQFEQTNQLTNINVTSSGVNVRNYNLTYTASATTAINRLTAIQECAGSSADDCLPATSVGYQDGTAGVASPATASGSGATNGTVYTVDIDGDGRQDLVFATTSGSNYVWWVQFATATGYGTPISTGAVTTGTTNFLLDDFSANGATEILAPSGGIWFAYKWNSSSRSFISSSTQLAVVPNVLYANADVDGDGRPDLVYFTQATNTIAVQLNTSAGGAITFASTPVVTSFPGSFGATALYGNNSLSNSSVKHFDFDGDGRQDLIVVLPGVHFGGGVGNPSVGALLSRGTGPFALGTTTSSAYTNFLAVNWNDDACTDLIVGLFVTVSQCNGGALQVVDLPAVPSLALDWDGDGRTDVLVNVGGTWQLYRSEGNSVAPVVSTGVAVGTGAWAVTDKDGDGLADLLTLNPSSSNSINYGLHNGANVAPDLLTSITDGFGLKISPTYTSIVAGSTAGTYQQGTGALYPEKDYQGPISVVNQTTTSDGIGGTYTNMMYYTQARFNVQGRGFEGFYEQRNHDSRNSLYHYQYFQQPFPTTGGLYSDQLLQSDDVTKLRVTNYTWTCVPITNTNCTVLNAAANNQRYFPYVNAMVESDYEDGGTLNGKLITQITTTPTYDSYGNATNIVTATKDEDSTTPSPFYGQTWSSTTARTISPNTANWCLGLPTLVTVTKTPPVGAALTRTSAFTPDYPHCDITQQVVEPGPPTGAITATTIYGRDTCGNINSVTVNGTNPDGTAMASRQTTYNYTATTTRCQFPETTTNALSQKTTTAYDYNKGVPLSITDPNNLMTSWTYDDFARKEMEQRADGTQTTFTPIICVTCYAYSKYYISRVEKDSSSSHNAFWSGAQFFDMYNRLVYNQVEASNASNVVNAYEYDQLGRQTAHNNPNGNGFNGYWVTNTYDDLNRLTSTYRPISSTNTVPQYTYYTYQGRISTIKDPKNYTRTKVSDVVGELRTLQDPSGTLTTYTYDAFGNVTAIRDPGGHLTARSYDVRGHLLTSSDPDRGAWVFRSDSLGEQIDVRDAKTLSPNWTQTNSFDTLGRIEQRVESEGTSTWTWGTAAANHEIGRLAKLAGLSDTETFTYDSVGRLNTHLMTWNGVTYTIGYNYNTIGKLNELIYPLASGQTNAFTVLYGYSNGYLSSLQNYTGGTAGTTFWKLTPSVVNMDPWGHVSDETLGTTTTVRIQSAFDPVTSWIKTRQVGSGGAPANLQNLAYQWDLNGNLSQREDVNQNLTEVFVNDGLNRISTSTLNGTQNLSVSMDLTDNTGNISSVTETLGGTAYTFAYAYDPIHVHGISTLTYNGVALPYGYDANGNMTNRQGSTVIYSSYNLPTNISGPGGVESTFLYGPDRQRKEQVATYATDGTVGTETTVYVAGLYEHEITPAQTHNKYFLQVPGGTQIIFDIASVSGTQTTYVTSDHLGSAGLFMDATGAVKISESYSAYGYRRSSNWADILSSASSDFTEIAGTTRRGYSDAFHEMLDNLTLIHMNGRVYDPTIGRFLSPDPIIARIGDSQGGNPYSYVENNPLRSTDPTGYDDQEDCVGGGGACPNPNPPNPDPNPNPDPKPTDPCATPGACLPEIPVICTSNCGADIPASPPPDVQPPPFIGEPGGAPAMPPIAPPPPPPRLPPPNHGKTGICSNASINAISNAAGGAVAGGAALSEFGPGGIAFGALVGGLVGGVVGYVSSTSLGDQVAGGAANGAVAPSFNAATSGAAGGAIGGAVTYGTQQAGIPDVAAVPAGAAAGGFVAGAAATGVADSALTAAEGGATGGVIGLAAGATTVAVAAALKAACGN